MSTDMDLITASSVCKALGHPLRFRLVAGLCRHHCSVNEIAEKLKLPQSTVSQQLGILRDRGIIVPRKDGVRTCYDVVNKFALEIVNLVQCPEANETKLENKEKINEYHKTYR